MKTIEPLYTERYVQWCGRSATQLMGSLLPDHPARKEKPARSVLRPHSVRECDRRGFLFDAFLKNLCRIIRRHDRLTAHPRHGSMQARCGTPARYRQTAAAGDEAAHTNPSVPPFYPAIRVFAVHPASAALPCAGQPCRYRSCL